ncbi:hypothetical protein [Streptomyces sioyaensis]|uniref:hypothetical protein n=1 Tax=Streptomyces sioyaensis TaxID=67364 RepID=UPI003711B2F9
MQTDVPPFAPAARAAYAAFPRRRDATAEMTDRLERMLAYTSARAQVAVWAKIAPQLDAAVVALHTAATTRRGRRATRRAAKVAIEAFEQAYAVSLPYDDHGRYNPAPGTEYPFSVSDIGRAAVQLLGPDWEAESTPWGVGASIEHTDETFGYLLTVDERGYLYLVDDGHGGSRTEVEDATAADGLPSLAARVAEIVHELHNAED